MRGIGPQFVLASNALLGAGHQVEATRKLHADSFAEGLECQRMDNYLELDSLESTMVAVMCTTLDTATATILYSKDTCPLDHGYDEVLKCFQRFKANYQQTAGTKPPGRRFHRGLLFL